MQKVIDQNASVSSPTSIQNTSFWGNASSKKEANSSNDKAKAYFKEKLKILDTAIEARISEFTAAEKFGEHKHWQHTLIMQTPKKDLPMVASPVKFFSRAGSATKQFFAPFFRRSASLLSLASGEQSNAQNMSGGGGAGDAASHVAEMGDASAKSGLNLSTKDDGGSWAG